MKKILLLFCGVLLYSLISFGQVSLQLATDALDMKGNTNGRTVLLEGNLGINGTGLYLSSIKSCS